MRRLLFGIALGLLSTLPLAASDGLQLADPTTVPGIPAPVPLLHQCPEISLPAPPINFTGCKALVICYPECTLLQCTSAAGVCQSGPDWVRCDNGPTFYCV